MIIRFYYIVLLLQKPGSSFDQIIVSLFINKIERINEKDQQLERKNEVKGKIIVKNLLIISSKPASYRP